MNTYNITNSRNETGKIAFYFAILYLIAEYMRPQQMYDLVAGMPLAMIAIGGMAVSAFIGGRRFNNNNNQNYYLMLYFLLFFISSTLAFRPDYAFQALNDFWKVIVIYFLLINIINEKNRLYIFLLIFLLLNFKYSQHAVKVWINKGFYSDPRGLNEGAGIGSSFFKNPNDFGAALNSILGISYYMFISDTKKVFNWFKMRWLHFVICLTMPIAILSTSSRGASVAFGASLIAILFKSKKKMLGTIIVTIIAVAFIALIPDDNKARFERIGTEKDNTGTSRVNLWKAGIQMANEFPLTGVGPDNFMYVNIRVYQNDLLEVQHNIFVQAVSELGYPGLIVLVIMISGCFYNQSKTRRILREKGLENSFLYGLSHGLDVSLVGFMVNGFFITVLYYPFFWIIMVLSVALLNVAGKVSPESDNISTSTANEH